MDQPVSLSWPTCNQTISRDTAENRTRQRKLANEGRNDGRHEKETGASTKVWGCWGKHDAGSHRTSQRGKRERAFLEDPNARPNRKARSIGRNRRTLSANGTVNFCSIGGHDWLVCFAPTPHRVLVLVVPIPHTAPCLLSFASGTCSAPEPQTHFAVSCPLAEWVVLYVCTLFLIIMVYNSSLFGAIWPLSFSSSLSSFFFLFFPFFPVLFPHHVARSYSFAPLLSSKRESGVCPLGLPILLFSAVCPGRVPPSSARV